MGWPSEAAAVWTLDWPRAWLAIPLAHGNTLIAFVVLAPPHSYSLDWESFDLLRAAGPEQLTGIPAAEWG